jgi:hypothetical protein
MPPDDVVNLTTAMKKNITVEIACGYETLGTTAAKILYQA